MSTEDDLFAAWCGGDRAAGDELVRILLNSIHRFIASAVSSDVEELVQRTFTRVAEKRSRYRGEGGARTFVFGVARNILREHYRRRGRNDEDIEEMSVRDMSPGPSTLRWRKVEDERLLECMRTLPLRMQLALQLVYWDGLTMKQVAEILEVPQGTVASRLRRARLQLRAQFEGTSTSLVDVNPDDGLETESAELWAERIERSAPDPSAAE